MGFLLLQTFLLMLASFFLGALLACLLKSALFGSTFAAREPELAAVSGGDSAVAAPNPARSSAASPPMIEVTSRAALAPAAPQTEATRFERALTEPGGAALPVSASALAAEAARSAGAVRAEPAADAAATAAALAAAARQTRSGAREEAAPPEAVAKTASSSSGVPTRREAQAAATPAIPRPGAMPQPAASGSASTPPAQDLTRIRGIDEPLERRLGELGVRRYEQIAAWRAGDVAGVSGALGFKGRIQRENWIEQAQILATGGETAFARQRAQAAATSRLQPLPTSAAAPASTAVPLVAPQSRPAASATGSVPAVGGAGLGAKSSGPAQAARPNEPRPPGAEALRSTAGGDDLKRIRGIGVLLEKKLNGFGVTRYAQIAAWTRAEVERFGRVLDVSGRIEREGWIEQARVLAAGGQPESSRRLDTTS